MSDDAITRVARDLIYCANKCSRPTDSGRIPVQTTSPSHLCRHCEHNLANWLKQIPTLYAMLPTFLEHGATEQNPDSKRTKAAEAPAPMRLDILDMLDHRLGRHWQGLTPTTDRRGAVGELLAICADIIDRRQLHLRPDPTVTSAAAFIERHRTWLNEQDWVDIPYDTLKQLHRQLSDAIGDYRRPPIGKCHVDTDTGTCGGNLYANTYGGVRCVRCGATWDANHLRQLGLAQATKAQETA